MAPFTRQVRIRPRRRSLSLWRVRGPRRVDASRVGPEHLRLLVQYTDTVAVFLGVMSDVRRRRQHTDAGAIRTGSNGHHAAHRDRAATASCLQPGRAHDSPRGARCSAHAPMGGRRRPQSLQAVQLSGSATQRGVPPAAGDNTAEMSELSLHNRRVNNTWTICVRAVHSGGAAASSASCVRACAARHCLCARTSD